MSVKVTLPTRQGKILRGPDADAHYYDQRGNPRYDITDIRQAKKLNLIASATTKLGMQPAFPVVNWKVLSGMDAALTTKRRIPAIMPVGAKEIWDLPANLEKPEFEIQVAGETIAGPFATYAEAIDALGDLRGTKPDLWESEEFWGKRIGEAYEDLISRAAKFGSKFHDQMEAIAKGEPIPAPPEDPVRPFAEHGLTWFRENIVRVYAVEAVVINYENMSVGTTDLIAEHRTHGLVFLDWKTQNIKNKDKESGRPLPEFYDKWCAQLGVYRKGVDANPPPEFPAGLDLSRAKCVNVVFDSNTPAPGIEYVWTERDLEKAARTYDLCSQMFDHSKEYTPEIDEEARAEVLARQPTVAAAPAPVPEEDEFMPTGISIPGLTAPKAAAVKVAPPPAPPAAPQLARRTFAVRSSRAALNETTTKTGDLVQIKTAYEQSGVSEVAPAAPAAPAVGADGVPTF